MKKIFARALSLVVILSVLCCSLVFVTSAVSSHTTQVLELSKTEHSSCTSPGSINFVDGWYKFENAGDHVLGTGPILGKKVSDFTWEFDYASDDPSWRQECFMFHANSDGIYESDTYTLRIEGNGMFGGIRLFKNADYNNPIATYKPEGGILTKTWDGHIWHTKIEVKNNQCKIWFYNINNPATTEPVITVDLGNAELTSGDFKVQGYVANMMLDNMVIKTDDVDYYFDPDDAPADSGNSGGNTGDDGNDDEGGNKVITLGKTNHSSCTSPGSINFVDGWYKFENPGDYVLGTGPILGKKVSNFTWEFDYASDDPSWRQECFMFHANSDGIYESDTYTLRIEGNGMFGGIRLFKNANYNNPIATYKPEGGILTKTWDGHIWHTKIEVKDNLCKIWFYNINNPATTEPVITVDLGNAELTSGDFKVQGYIANMMLDNMVIKTDDGNYYFDAADVPICLHTNTKEVVTKEATYFTEGSKNIVCSECAKKLEKDVVIYCDKANPVVFEEPVLNPATNQLKVEWEYSDALATDLLNATTKELIVKFAFGDKEYSLKLDDVDELGQVLYIEGINAARFAQNFSISLEFVVDAYNTTELNAAAKSLAVKVSDTVDANNAKAEDYADLIEEIAKVDEAVVAGKGQDNDDFKAGASKVDIKAGTAEIKFVATQDLIDTLKAKAQYNDGRVVTLVITIGEESHEIELAKLMSIITVKISGLSFDQMYGKISAKLVIDYAEIEDITTETVEFDFVNSINNSDNAVAIALKTLLGLPPKFKDTFVQTHSTKDSLNLKVDYTTEISPGKAGWWESGVEYSRIIELQHSKTGHNGVLIATFEELNGGQVPECGYPIYISLDKGKTWTKRGFVTDTDGFSAQWMPTLYELPKQLGNLPAGTILLAGTSLGNQATRNVLYQSQDLGKTWEPYSTIAVGGDYTKGEGLYEPFLVMLDDGTLVCHYADETEKEDHSQRLVYKTTKDGKNWSEAVETVALKEKDYRPGMPVVTRLGDGRYFMVYELGNGDGYPVYCRYSSNGLDWGNKEEHGILIESNGKSLGSAPYCAWSPYGGEKGTLIVSGCYMKSGNSSTGTDYFVSNDYGKTWETMPHPIPYNKNHSKMGYSNGFCFSKSGEYLYAVNNPEGATTGFSKIMFAAVKMH